MKKIYIIVGESSGEFIACKLINDLRKERPSTFIFRGIGGKKMTELGMSLLVPMDQINFIGFFEILPHIFKLKNLINDTVKDILLFEPDLVITIDCPGFNQRVVQKLRYQTNNMKIVHFVAPSVWAYNSGRAKKYADLYDHLFTILPFEAPYFEREGLCCTYIGHPVLDQPFIIKDKIHQNSSKLINICITPGSRLGEISQLMPIFAEALIKLKKVNSSLNVIFVIADQSHEKFINRYLKNVNYDYIFSNDKLSSFSQADVAIAKSGTNILEIAASNTAMIVCYKINFMSFWFLKRILKIKYASLINIIANREIIPELIQDQCNSENIANKIQILIDNQQERKSQIDDCLKVLSSMTLSSSSPTIAAKTILTEFF